MYGAKEEGKYHVVRMLIAKGAGTNANQFVKDRSAFDAAVKVCRPLGSVCCHGTALSAPI